ncbi:MAG: aldo/keto reductase [Myxococcales bacterium]|nr:aldo/keto reductase [Myxococcales bacterium]
MKERPLGRTGRRLPIVGQGTWRLESESRAEAVRALQRGIELGLTHIDTAELFGRGAVEELVGEAIAGYRGSVFLSSKVVPDHATYAGTLLACERSLRRLRTDRLDLYLVQRPSEHPLEETMRAMETLKHEGKILHYGVSNFDVADLEHACALVGAENVACNQVLYHLGERDIEHVLLPVCERLGVSVVGYSPFGSGDFPDPASPEGRVLVDIGRKYFVGPRAVALAFLVRRDSLFAIPKATTPAHVDDNARAGALELTPYEIERIDTTFGLGPPRSHLPTV